MNARRPLIALLAAGILTLTAACGDPGSSGTAPPSTAASASGGSDLASCDPIADQALMVLEDDKKLQTVDNVVPAVNSGAAGADPALVPLLDAVSATLDTPALVDLNKAVDVDRKTSSQVAEEYLTQNDLTTQDQVGAGRQVVVGAGNFSESATLAELYAGVLRAAGYDATTQAIGNRETYLPAVEAGAVTVVPEYAGTLTEFLNKGANGSDAPALASSDLDATMGQLATLGETVGLVFGTPAAAQDQNAFAVTKAFADKYDVATLSDLAATCGGVTLGGPPECPERPFCQLGLEKTYGLQVGEFVSLDAGGPLSKTALQQGKVALGLVLSSDAALAG
jgi:osmoprotectant transport system substrate-binding protein